MNKSLKIIIVVVLFVISLGSGCLLIKEGIDTARDTKQKLQEEKNNQKIKELQKQKEALTIEEEALKKEQSIEYKKFGESKKYQELENKIKKLTEDKKSIDFEVVKTQNGYYNNPSDMNKSVASSLLYITPGIVLFIAAFAIIIFGLKKVSK